MRTTIAHKNQSLLDISIQEYGSIEAVLDIAIENNISITDPLSPGQVILLPGNPIDQDIVTYFDNRKIKPATGIIQTAEQQNPQSLLFEPGLFAPELFA